MVYCFKLKLKVAKFPTLADFSTLPMNPPPGSGLSNLQLQWTCFLAMVVRARLLLSGSPSLSLWRPKGRKDTHREARSSISIILCVPDKKSCRRTPLGTAHTSDSANLPQRGPSPIKPSGKSLRAQSMKNNHYFLLWCQPAQQRVPLTALKGIYSFPHLSHFILLT